MRRTGQAKLAEQEAEIRRSMAKQEVAALMAQEDKHGQQMKAALSEIQEKHEAALRLERRKAAIARRELQAEVESASLGKFDSLAEEIRVQYRSQIAELKSEIERLHRDLIRAGHRATETIEEAKGAMAREQHQRWVQLFTTKTQRGLALGRCRTIIKFQAVHAFVKHMRTIMRVRKLHTELTGLLDYTLRFRRQQDKLESKESGLDGPDDVLAQAHSPLMEWDGSLFGGDHTKVLAARLLDPGALHAFLAQLEDTSTLLATAVRQSHHNEARWKTTCASFLGQDVETRMETQVSAAREQGQLQEINDLRLQVEQLQQQRQQDTQDREELAEQLRQALVAGRAMERLLHKKEKKINQLRNRANENEFELLAFRRKVRKEKQKKEHREIVGAVGASPQRRHPVAAATIMEEKQSPAGRRVSHSQHASPYASPVRARPPPAPTLLAPIESLDKGGAVSFSKMQQPNASPVRQRYNHRERHSAPRQRVSIVKNPRPTERSGDYIDVSLPASSSTLAATIANSTSNPPDKLGLSEVKEQHPHPHGHQSYRDAAAQRALLPLRRDDGGSSTKENLHGRHNKHQQHHQHHQQHQQQHHHHQHPRILQPRQQHLPQRESKEHRGEDAPDRDRAKRGSKLYQLHSPAAIQVANEHPDDSFSTPAL